MPITEGLKNIKQLESVGFPHEQAEALADIIEQAQLSGQEGLKEFISNENKDIRNDFDTKLNNVYNELSSKFDTSYSEHNTKLDNSSYELNTRIESSYNKLNTKIDSIYNELNTKIDNTCNQLNTKIDNTCNQLNTKIDNSCNDLNIKLEKILGVTDNIDTHIKAGQYDLLIKIFAIVTGTAGILFALLKLFG